MFLTKNCEEFKKLKTFKETKNSKKPKFKETHEKEFVRETVNNFLSIYGKRL